MFNLEIIEGGIAALLWAAVFLWGGRALAWAQPAGSHRHITSVGAGMSIAYVFMHMMPELHEVRVAFAESVSWPLAHEGMVTYLLALIGFLTFFALRQLHPDRHEAAANNQAGPAFWLSVAGFGAYTLVMGYLLTDSHGETEVSIALYAIALTFHFLAVDRALHHEFGHTYDRIGRPLLALLPIIGWAAGTMYAVPQQIIALLVAFLSGAIIMNATILELQSESEGHFLPMMAGGVIYGLILLPLG